LGETDLKWGQGSRMWLAEDKFGLSWQIVPDALFELLGDKNPLKSQKVMQAMLQMKKIDVAKLKQAAEQ
jgi:predicted 3-demethylubiquinone-9 3-methyltransferase (glyoxalase superfamily)